VIGAGDPEGPSICKSIILMKRTTLLAVGLSAYVNVDFHPTLIPFVDAAVYESPTRN